MTTTYTYGDLDRLRDQPGRVGPLTKLMETGEQLSTVDKFRIVKFHAVLDGVLTDYGKMIAELGTRFGEPVPGQPGYFRIRPEQASEYVAEKAKVDATEVINMPSLTLLPVSAYDKVPLSPSDLVSLEKFIVPPTDP